MRLAWVHLGGRGPDVLRRLLRDPLLWALLGFLAAFLCWRLALAALGDPLPGCVPAYATLEPDAYAVSAFEVRILEPDARMRWHYTFTFASRPCCRETWRAVSTVLRQVQDPGTIRVGACT